MNDLPLGICLSIYPGLRNTCAELPKVVCSNCFKILRIHFKITRKTQEIAFQGFPISKFSRGSMPPDPLRYLAPSARNCPPWRRHWLEQAGNQVQQCRTILLTTINNVVPTKLLPSVFDNLKFLDM